ncbi:MAG: SOS response-associated peptidase [Hyphomonadaceae bacterium]|nr:SOS response-associated peptidase [Hyphomonadaceae bacterium]
MCNLYSMTKSRQAVLEFARAMRDRTANEPPLPAIFPDQLAPVVRTAKDGAREILNMRWGFPPAGGGARPVTNVRNLQSAYWRGWLEDARFRCLVPATSFVEYTDTAPKVAHWFALGEARPLFCFAGIWRPWTGVRAHEEGEHRLFSFLTTHANALVRPIHAKAMPVILSAETMDVWLDGSAEEALALAQPFPPERMQIVLSGPREDSAA